MTKNLSSEYSHKGLDYANSLPQMHLKLLQKQFFKNQQK